DIERGILYEYNWGSKEVNTWSFDHRVTMVIQAEDNQVILALDRSIARFDLETEQLQWLVHLEKELPNNRCNDGACDSQGRIWVGTMALDIAAGAASLYCIDRDGAVTKKIPQETISKGIGWAADDRTLYFIDTPTRKVQGYRLEKRYGGNEIERTAN